MAIMSLDTGLEFLSDHVLRVVKGEVAWRLYRAGYTQLNISRLLGVTQPMVNKIISSHDELRNRAAAEGLDLADIDSMAGIAVSLVIDGKVQEALEYLTNKSLLNLSRLDYCSSHRQVNPRIPPNCRACELILSPRDVVIRNLVSAVSEVEGDEAFARLVPRVLMNIAESIPNPRNEMDIAAVPGRIGLERGRPRAWGVPAYGVSTHLGRVMLEVGRRRPRIRAVASIRYDKEIEKSLEVAGFKYSVIAHSSAPSEDEVIKLVAEEASSKDVDAVVDMGGFGMEPITYVFGGDSLDVIYKLKRILDNLGKTSNS
ncbi:transcriptional regulator [Thermocladium modestius]|uniref:Transcriptional regulator n=2 Tax=Thermocladium modestius TaxID=62609 RepID=A0A830GV04_9CREN|nr:transcriptional regulator [Thermocladium modestius]